MFMTQNSLSLLQPEFEILSPFFTGEAWTDGFNKRSICEDEEILNIHLYLSFNMTDHNPQNPPTSVKSNWKKIKQNSSLIIALVSSQAIKLLKLK